MEVARNRGLSGLVVVFTLERREAFSFAAGGAIRGLLPRGDVDSPKNKDQGKASENIPAIFLQGIRRVDRRPESATGTAFALRLWGAGLPLLIARRGERSFSGEFERRGLADSDIRSDFHVGVGLTGKGCDLKLRPGSGGELHGFRRNRAEIFHRIIGFWIHR